MQLNDLTTCGGCFTDENGAPVAGGLLACYIPGSSVLKALYAADGTQLANPAGIGSDGYLSTPAYLGSGVSELKLYAPNVPGAIYDPDDFPGSDWRLVRSWQVRGSNGSTALPGVGSVAELQAFDCSGLSAGAVVAVSGYYASGDCPTRLFTLRDGTATGNGGTIFPALGGGRYWEWEPQGAVDVRTFGAVPGSNEDSTPAFVSAAAYANSQNLDLWLLPGIYTASGASISVDGVKIEDGVSVLVEDAGETFALNIGKRFDIQLSSGFRHASSAGKVLLDFSGYTGSAPVRTLWNEGWDPSAVGSPANADDVVNWAPASGTLVVSGSVNLAQDVARIEIEAATPDIIAYDTATSTQRSVNIGEIVSAGGQAMLSYGTFTIGKAYASAMKVGRTCSVSAPVLVDADWTIGTSYPAPDYSGVTLCGVPGGGLVKVTTTSDIPSATIAGVNSETAIFGDVSGIYGTGAIVCADASKPVKAQHFATLDSKAVKLVAASNGGTCDLGGLTATLETPTSYRVENGSVAIPANTAWTTSANFKRCKVSIGSGVVFASLNPLDSISVEMVDCETDAQIVVSGLIQDFLLLRNTYTGAGSALDVSGVTSWAGTCRIAENQPVSFNKSPTTPYWPQTEGELRSGGSGALVDYTDASKGGDTAPLVAADSLRMGFASCTATACYALGITGGLRAQTYDGNAAGAGAIWSVRFNFTKLS